MCFHVWVCTLPQYLEFTWQKHVVLLHFSISILLVDFLSYRLCQCVEIFFVFFDAIVRCNVYYWL